jgi:hypothetical protein
MELSEEAMEYLKGAGREQELYFLESKVGVGLLHKGFDRQAGMGIYLHIHGSPVSLSRLLRGGLPAGWGPDAVRVSSDMEDRGRVRKWDETACGALLDAWSEIRGREAEGGVWTTRGDGFLSVFDLERGLEELAAFAGCRVNLSRDRVYPGGMEGISWAPTRVRCYSPRLLEALSLFLMTGAGTLSTDRQVNCRLATRGEGCHLLLFLEYSVHEKTLAGENAAAWETACQHMELVAELSGLDLHTAVMMPTRKEKREGKLPLMTVCLEWTRDPAVLPTTDLKAHLKLLYEAEERN